MKDYSFEEPFEKYPLAMLRKCMKIWKKATKPVPFSPNLTNPLQEGDVSNEQ